MAATSFSKASSRQTGGTNRGPSKSRPSDGKSRGHNNVGSSLSQQLQQNQSKREIVGNYSIQKKLGVGTFGEVRLAIHIPTGEKVAIKILEKSRLKEQAEIRRVNREINILKKARHCNIIQLYEVLDTPTAIYLIMENAEGGELFDYIVAHRHVSELQACKFFHQIVDGVDALHKKNITHRDLKPENLLLKAAANGWIVKIVDFGLSNTHEGNNFLITACGSPCYAAPEIIAGKEYFGPLADIWSIGVILFALVCGFLPFEDANTANLYKKILSGDYHAPKWISGEVRNLLRKILETEPTKRYTLENIRNHAWYGSIKESEIPKDILSEIDQKSCHEETIQIMSNAGNDIQNVLESVTAHSCNSVTATYYLLQQKHRTKKELMNNNNIVHNKIIESKNQINLLNAFNRPEKVTPIDMTKIGTIKENNPTDNNYNNNNNNSSNNNNNDINRKDILEDKLNEKVVIYKGHLAIECNQIKENLNLDNNSIYNDNNNMKNILHTINNNSKNNANNNNSNNIKNLNNDFYDASPITSPRSTILQNFQPAPPSVSSSSAGKGPRPRGGTTAKPAAGLPTHREIDINTNLITGDRNLISSNTNCRTKINVTNDIYDICSNNDVQLSQVMNTSETDSGRNNDINTDDNNNINNRNNDDNTGNVGKDISKGKEDCEDIRAVETVGTSQKEVDKNNEIGQQRELINISRKERFSVQPTAPVSAKNPFLDRKSPRTPGISVRSNVHNNCNDNSINGKNNINNNSNNNNDNSNNDNYNNNNNDNNNNNSSINDNNNNENVNINSNSNDIAKGGNIRKNSNITKISNTVAGVIAAARLLGTPKRPANRPNIKLNSALPSNSIIYDNDNGHTNENNFNINNGKSFNINHNDTNNSKKINSFPIKKKLLDGRMKIPLVTGLKFRKKTDENMDIVGIKQNNIKNSIKNNIIIGNIGSEKLLNKKKNGKTNIVESFIVSDILTPNSNKNGKVKNFMKHDNDANKITMNNFPVGQINVSNLMKENELDGICIDLNSRIILKNAADIQSNNNNIKKYGSINNKNGNNDNNMKNDDNINNNYYIKDRIRSETDSFSTPKPLINLKNEFEHTSNVKNKNNNLDSIIIYENDRLPDVNNSLSSNGREGRGKEVEMERPGTRRGSSRSSPKSITPSHKLSNNDGNSNNNYKDDTDDIHDTSLHTAKNTNIDENDKINNIKISINDIVVVGKCSNLDVLVINFNNIEKNLKIDDNKTEKNLINNFRKIENNDDDINSTIIRQSNTINININDLINNNANCFVDNNNNSLIDRNSGFVQVHKNNTKIIEDFKIENNTKLLTPKMEDEVFDDKEDVIRIAHSPSIRQESSLKKNVPHAPNSLMSSFNSLRGRNRNSITKS